MMLTSSRVKNCFIFSVIYTLFLLFLGTIAISDPEVGDSIPRSLDSDICQDKPVVIEEKTYGDYKLKISSAGDQSCHLLDIERNGKPLYHDEEIGGYFFFGPNFEEERSPFIHITGHHNPDLVYSKWTGGAHCCYSLHIFELESVFKKVADIEGGNSQPVLADLDRDGIPEITVADDFLAYLFSSFASSATGGVVLKYLNHEYRVASEYMIKPAPALISFNKKIKTWRRQIRKHGPDWPPPSLMQTITDLVYSGNIRTAFALVDQTWPADVVGKEVFIKSYEDALNESRFYSEFQKHF